MLCCASEAQKQQEAGYRKGQAREREGSSSNQDEPQSPQRFHICHFVPGQRIAPRAVQRSDTVLDPCQPDRFNTRL